MAVSAVDFLIDNLEKLLLDNNELIVYLKEEADSLLNDLKSLNAFLKQASKSRSENEILKDLVKKMRITVNEAEDCIDKFVTETKLHQNKGIIKLLDVSQTKRNKEAVAEIRSIRDKLKDIRRNSAYGLQTFQFDEPHSKSTVQPAPVMVEDDVVGFDEEANIIINRLVQKSDQLEVIPVVGMLGLGKTTLAYKIFSDSRVRNVFDKFIWVTVSQGFDKKEVFLNIIRMLDEAGQYQHVPIGELADNISKRLFGKSYLIVLDDVWTSEIWEEISPILPNTNNGSKVLLTTRDTEVANKCNERPHHLKFLNDAECWQLLQKKLSRKCPQDLEDLGQLIASKCMGLPLAIVLISGILNRTGRTRSDYEQVIQKLNEGLIHNDNEIGKNLVRMSYDSLPLNLKLCFLYCGVFPIGFKIPAWKLIRLWISEGFVQNQKTSTLESIALQFLNELVNKNLLVVNRRTSDGRIRTCCIHNVLHEFCREEASEENLFQEIKLGIEQSFPRNQELATYRRLCIGSSITEFLSAKPLSECIRSFLCFDPMAPSDAAIIPKAFPLLRVFHVEHINFNDISPKFSQLFHLRYLSFSSNSIKILPKFIGDLWNLQTLIVVTKEKTLDIQADILNMPHLRHLHTNASAKLNPPAALKTNKPTSVPCKSLQTLSTIEPESCTEHVVTRSQNLKKLGIRGKIGALFQNNMAEPSSNINQLDFLENLKLINDDTSAGRKLCLPSKKMFPTKLKKLTLSGTMLEWAANMVILKQLPALEVLKLKDSAFTGDCWESKGDGFPCLKVLWIEGTDLVTWKASSDVFPSLKRLVLVHCNKLEEIPMALAKICSLHELKLEDTTRKAAECARKIQADSECIAFKLSILPRISDSN